MAHSVFSPSSAHRWLVCPGSIAANRDKPRSDNPYSLQGTAAHALLEVCLRTGALPERFEGRVLEARTPPVDEGMTDGVTYAIDYVNAYLANHPKAVMHAESQVAFGASVGVDDEEAFGTSDIMISDYPHELVVIDYKHGTGHAVTVKKNPQLMLYAAGGRQKLGRYRRYLKVVIQPRLRGRKPITEASITDKELALWLSDTVAPRIVEIKRMGEDAPRVAGPHCHYCHADGRCPAQYQQVMKAASAEFRKSDPKALSPAQLGEALTALSELERVGKLMKEHATRLAHAGGAIPGWEASWTSPNRAWRDEAEATQAIHKMGVRLNDMYETTVLSPAKMEDLMRSLKLWPRKPRGAVAEFVKDPLEPLVVRPAPAPALRKAHKDT